MPSRARATHQASPISYYSKTFSQAETPVQLGGVCQSSRDPYATGVNVENISGTFVMHGTQTGGGFDDSECWWPNVPPNHTIQATVWKAGGIAASPNAEVELLLSWRDDGPTHDTGLGYGNTNSTGYEININQNGNYFILGTFKGPELTRVSSPPVPVTGDVMKAKIVRNGDGSADITIYWNGVAQTLNSGGTSYHHTTPPAIGGPGLGFYIDSGIANNVFGFTSVTITSP